ncbi:MAG: molybdopterin molybdotransferase MoeA [bacterium]|nr:molybdopterin molybdotransferase MoeA [bacterium]
MEINSLKNITHSEYIDIYQAINLIEKNINFNLKEIEVKIEEATNYILSQDIISKIDNPPFNNSAMDGIAIKFEDLTKNTTFQIITLLKAQKYNNLKIKNTKDSKYPVCIEISTGAFLPPEFDTIIPYENIEFINNKLVKIKEDILNKIRKYQHVRFKGEDFKKNELILSKNTLITPFSLSILAANGIKKIKVYKKPTISLITTGNEIISLNNKIKLGQIYNSNKYSLLAYIKKYAKTGIIKHTKDSKKEIQKAISQAIKISDIIITIGGISKGKYDLINDILTEIGAKIIFKKLKVKPGKPTTFSIYENKTKKILIFSLPGNPISALFNFNKLVIPAIFKLQNYNYSPLIIPAKLKEDIRIKKTDDRLTMLPTYCYLDNNEYIIKPIEKWGSHTIGILNTINSYIEINTDHIPKNTILNCFLLEK